MSASIVHWRVLSSSGDVLAWEAADATVPFDGYPSATTVGSKILVAPGSGGGCS